MLALLFLALFTFLGPIAALAGGRSDESDCRAEAEAHVAAGDLAGAAYILETGATRISGHAFPLYRQAAWLRERRGEIGQALLDYRAMLKSAPDPSAGQDLKRHIAYRGG